MVKVPTEDMKNKKFYTIKPKMNMDNLSQTLTLQEKDTLNIKQDSA
jgi:hypothetical protein